MKKIMMLICLNGLLFPLSDAQTIYTIDSVAGCEGGALILPVKVYNYYAMNWKLKIKFNHNVLASAGWQNFAGPGFIMGGVTQSVVSDFDTIHLSGQCFPALQLTGGATLVELTFIYLGGEGFVEVIPGTIPAGIFNNSRVSSAEVEILNQPVSTITSPGSTASFFVTTSNDFGLDFQWQVNTDGTAWSNLSENPPYEGVHSDLLIIDPVPEIFDLYQYRCIIEGCTIDTSQPAILEVNAITTVQGSLSYANAFSSPVEGAEITFTQGGIPVSGSVTDANGQFSLDNLPPGTYEIQTVIPYPWTGVNAIDGMTILKHFAGLQVLSGFPLTAADVNLSGTVNSIDAMMVIQRFVGMISSFDLPDWIVDVQSVEVPVIGIVDLPIETICAGDVNASHIP
ncbi:MAG TPA: carboxypeptidase regulatory-like domain-containing protein [Bacteroidales bacterium]|nr:carboxypeptidase regulatory-like domain-containing protein [Bacteroidales bacterium]HSA43807.1 carboxypeptidase regulatory-like domain-containing protein [Bacteroidales bacterium]